MQQFVGQSPGTPCRSEAARGASARDLIPACTWIVEDTTFRKGNHSIGWPVSTRARRQGDELSGGGVASARNRRWLHAAELCPLSAEEWTSNPSGCGRLGFPKDEVQEQVGACLDLVDEARTGISEGSWSVPRLWEGERVSSGLLKRKLSYVAEIEANTIVLDRRSAEKEEGPAEGRRGRGVEDARVTNFARFFPLE